MNESLSSNETFKNLVERFTRLFNENGIKNYDRFDKNVWFLRNKGGLLIPEGSTPTGISKNDMIDILEKTSINGMNFTKLDVKTEDFIKEISKVLYEYNNHKLKIEENLNKIQLRQKLENIGYKYQKSSSNRNKDNKFTGMNKTPGFELVDSEFPKTTLKYTISDINGLTEGEYRISAICKNGGNENYYLSTDKNKKLFYINRSSKNLYKDIVLEIPLEDNLYEFYDRKIFPIKEYYFEITKNSKIIFATDFVSFDSLVIRYIDELHSRSKIYIKGIEDKEEQSDLDNFKYSICYQLEIVVDNEIKEEIIKRTIYYYESLVNGIENIQLSIDNLINFFDEKFAKEIYELLKGKSYLANDSCACNNCQIF